MNIEKNLKLAFENHKKSNFQIAEKIYNDILKINPNHFESIFLLGTLSISIKPGCLLIFPVNTTLV